MVYNNSTTSNLSKWTHFEVNWPLWLTVLRGIIYLAIIITNILILATFVRMRKRKFQHHLMICLALVDLLTVPAQTPAIVALWKDGILLQQHGCMLLYALRNAIQF